VSNITASNAKNVKMLSGGIAASSALIPSGSVGSCQSCFDVGFAEYNGQAAIGMSYVNRGLVNGWNVNAGAAMSTGGGAKPIYRLGFGRVWD
jgi:trimeric autotransporter adhesin